MTSAVGTEVLFQMPMAAVDRFPRLLETLGDEGGTLGVDQVGVSITTMEEVFCKIARSAPPPGRQRSLPDPKRWHAGRLATGLIISLDLRLHRRSENDTATGGTIQTDASPSSSSPPPPMAEAAAALAPAEVSHHGLQLPSLWRTRTAAVS